VLNENLEVMKSDLRFRNLCHFHALTTKVVHATEGPWFMSESNKVLMLVTIVKQPRSIRYWSSNLQPMPGSEHRAYCSTRKNEKKNPEFFSHTTFHNFVQLVVFTFELLLRFWNHVLYHHMKPLLILLLIYACNTYVSNRKKLQRKAGAVVYE